MAEMLKIDEKMEDELDDIPPDYLGDLEEYHKNKDDGLEDIGEVVMADCHHRQHYPGHRFFVLYHGTTLKNAQKIQVEGFVPSFDGMLGRGVYLSRDFKKAARYPLQGRSQSLVVIMVNVRVGKVKRIDYQGHPLQKTWHQHGYDTAWVPPNCGMVASGLEEDCVYDPSRIEVLKIIPN
ncbi:grass carp reovirus (GCRV)-induced gene 2q [Ictalurus punctatus]|uniref:Grass carp reovirus (GCRV)-induced gene 2q n=1 Tax=Ictalurus punctatus TaxID=7998 RepID=A0A9F7RBA3_ICTPU|nr:grass carp reovirus (GCRV)-induced gene 2q [Ictalurus punctatus]XP_053537436.1 grass carp reovirus (GCRV)-induced gene 2q [Ictalurus punctatus]